MQFAGTLLQSAAAKLVRNPTSLPICKAGTLSGNTNDNGVSADRKDDDRKSSGGSVGDAALVEERHAWSGAA
jgi:hypothetical protein